jgi:hypothetical protein
MGGYTHLMGQQSGIELSLKLEIMKNGMREGVQE